GEARELGVSAGGLERGVDRGRQGAGDEAKLFGARGPGGEKNDWIGAIAAITAEVVLDGACVRKAQCFRFLRDRKRLGVVIGGALVGVIDGRKKLHAELHGVPSFRSACGECRPALIWEVVHYGATEPTVNRARPSPRTLRTRAPSRLTAFGRDLDFRSTAVDMRKGCAPCPPPPGPISARSARHGKRPISPRCGRM